MRSEKLRHYSQKFPMSRNEPRTIWLVFVLVLAAANSSLFAQAPAATLELSHPAQAADGAAANNTPLTITLQDALERARANDPQYHSAITDLGVAREDRVQARAALLPGVTYNNSYIYTEGTGQPPACALSSTCPASRFIANNGVHEYISQGNAHEAVSLTNFADYRRSSAALAQARAKAEIAARGLVVTVTQTYYALVIAQRKYSTSQRAATEAQRFLKISQQLQNGGEVARADVVKASIQSQQQQRDLQETQLAMQRSRLDLAVLIFPSWNQNFNVVDDLQTPEPLPPFTDVQVAGKKNNPDLRAALAALAVANHQVSAAWGGLLPSLSVDYFYGIDSNKFATRVNGVRALGYSAVATLQIPIFNWGADRSKLKQAELRRDQARLELTHEQRQLLSHLQQFYEEASVARAEMESLASSAELAAESLRLTNLRYQAGESTVLEIVDAQNTLTQARNAYDDGQVRYRVAVANLQTLTGSF
ncbi:MAG: outer rane efflux protein [Candidatus Sulfotelmatobacter sp.]|nr:outer rane efflux protein [Candidatus Sulfotelmatobacter sp.]